MRTQSRMLWLSPDLPHNFGLRSKFSISAYSPCLIASLRASGFSIPAQLPISTSGFRIPAQCESSASQLSFRIRVQHPCPASEFSISVRPPEPPCINSYPWYWWPSRHEVEFLAGFVFPFTRKKNPNRAHANSVISATGYITSQAVSPPVPWSQSVVCRDCRQEQKGLSRN